MAVDDCADGSLKDDFGFGVEVDLPLLDSLVVAHHALHAVALDSEQVGGEQHIADLAAFLLRETERLEHVGAEFLERFQAPCYICHLMPP